MLGCGNFSHLVRACPSKQVEEDNRSDDAEGAANGRLCRRPGVTGEAGEAELESAVARARAIPDGAQSAWTSKDALVSVEEESKVKKNVETEEDKGSQAIQEL